MTANDKLGHGGYACFAIGQLLIAQQLAAGYFAVAAGAGIWIHLGLKLRMTSIWAWEILCILTAVYGYWNWTH